MLNYGDKIKEDFKQYIIDCYGDGLGYELTADAWLTSYLESLSDIITEQGQQYLEALVNKAKMEATPIV